MKVLGEIKAVCAPRTFMVNGNPVVVYPIIFHGEGNEFVGDMFRSQEDLTRYGVRVGAVGKMEMEFKVREAKRSTGDSYPVQNIKFTRFTAANMGAFTENVPAASGAPAEEAAPVEAADVNPEESPI